ncbi:hypothetical protein [Synechococcus sp. CS-1328]|uniref:hypothetical protein n=1 Tax=Synechococcus sp. CS-1328 TaxID=2847976 RepID=UPI00223BCFAC|nr:hypothetical protein [Synechococcus sp. CS-1328]MCT0226317.1 hypothetical protein [Synechococcus sp. CS-1328]
MAMESSELCPGQSDLHQSDLDQSDLDQSDLDQSDLHESATQKFVGGHLNVRSVSDLSLYEDHSVIIQRLCKELGFEKPATAMAWVFDQLEQSKDLQKAIFDLLND